MLMKIPSPSVRVGRSACGVGLILLSAAGFAAVPVEESVPSSGPGPVAPAPDQGAVDSRSMGGGTGESGRLSQLFYQIQVLQQEVQALRGMVEEQSYRLERLSRDQQEQYLDLDRRMQALRDGSGRAPIASSAGAASATPSANPSAGGAAPGSEREAYSAAFDLMKQRQFDASAQAFQALIADYPNGAYTPNAFYWLGELHLARDEDEAARQAFAQVVNLYPDHQKVPDALYKLGVTHHRLGDVARAREYLNRVRSEFPRSSAAGLAQTYLAEL